MLIRNGELAQIERAVGPKPDEGLFRIERPGALEADGAGFKRGLNEVVSTVAGRVMHIGDLTPEQKLKLGVVRQDAKYLMTLKCFSDVRMGDTLVAIAQQWEPNKYYFAGRRVIPTVETGKTYMCTQAGRSQDEEPDWPVALGDSVDEYSGDDIAVSWFCSGDYLRYDVVEILGPSTFGDYIAKKVTCNLQQSVKGL